MSVGITLGNGWRTSVTRSDLYCGLIVVGFANGISERISNAIDRDGVVVALFNSFDVSVVMWAAGLVALSLLSRSERQPARGTDFAIAGVASAAFLMPIPSLSWLAFTGIAVYLAYSPISPPRMRRAAAVLGAMTIPMLWARILLATVSEYLLAADAKLVSWIVGTESNGNSIPFADGTGVLFLEPACSSLTNLSLVLLCGVVLVKAYDCAWSKRTAATILMACCAAIAINVIRISFIGVLPRYYDLIHGQVGATLAGWAIILTVSLIYFARIRPNEQNHT
jgi:exosortase/archaeosortase family protein